jgi:YhcH/YjgK/YiaL family protein
MILDRLDNASSYRGLGERVAAALDFLAKTNLHTTTVGQKIHILGSEVTGSVSESTTRPRDASRQFEAHRRFIDIHYVIRGTEYMGYAHANDLKITKPYEDADDYLLLDGPGDFFNLHAGMFVVFMPHDAHMPGLAASAPQPLRKIVVKVAV